MNSPVEQFTIKTLYDINLMGIDVSFTNASLFMFLSIFCSIGFLYFGARKQSLIPNRIQCLVEMSYEFVANMVKENAGKGSQAYFPFVFTLFMFILFGNLLGMIPYSYTFTSQIAVTFTLAAIIFVGVTLIALFKHGFKFFTYFFPSGVPIALAPLLIPIEIISYFIRPISLSVRLFANMLAGHTMMKVFAGLIIMMGSAGGLLKIGAVLPLLAVIGLTGLEFLVAALQAYVFSILTCMYLHDAIHLH
ncbi:MAG: F0F1 ATP synthase subunit A [SAR116 cluster bacterium]|jgi:F-type H+-transporting ATPase subunit a|nr:F0F1 ATP synthase subunit A [SAR116 cluster bacterium]